MRTNYMRPLVSCIIALALSSVSLLAQANKTIFLAGQNCSGTAATLAITASGLVRAAAGNGAIQFFTVDNAGGTLTVNCPIDVATRIGSSARITSVNVFYGTQATAPTSAATPVVNSVQLTTTPGSTTAVGTVAAAGGVLTVTPTSALVTATTTGTCYNERISFGTPIAAQPSRRFTVEQVFTFGAATGTVQICGIQVNYTDVP